MVDECNRHLDAAARLFADEGLDFAPVRDAWEHLRHAAAQPAMVAVSEPVRETARSIHPPASRRASVAVMPFRELGAGPQGRHDLGSAVAHDVISRLARLRSLFVIARGSVFAVAEEGLGLPEIGRRLGVDYVATGFMEQHDHGVCVTVEVAEAATARIIWTDQFEARSAERLAILDEVGDGIVSSIAAEIENEERNRAILKPPDSLDAWEAYHRGLWHMYRFTPEENARAAEFFRLSTRLDPTFSRAHAGLSFTHWQRAFQRWSDRESETRNALKTAGQSLLVDDQNPAAHWSMGRALWLSGDHDEAVRELEQSVRLSPNFALGHYALAFVHSQSGDPAAAIASSDHSRLLSPCDPLLFGMLGTRALALVSLGAFEEAAQWGVKAAARPNAHVHIVAIAALCLALAGRIEDARNYATRIRLQNSGYRIDNFLDTFQFAPEISARYRKAAALIGMSLSDGRDRPAFRSLADEYRADAHRFVSLGRLVDEEPSIGSGEFEQLGRLVDISGHGDRERLALTQSRHEAYGQARIAFRDCRDHPVAILLDRVIHSTVDAAETNALAAAGGQFRSGCEAGR